MGSLTAAQLEALRQSLVEVKQELESILEATKADAQPVQLDQPIGRLTRMDAIQQQKMLQAHRRRNEVRLQQVTAAISSVRRGLLGKGATYRYWKEFS